MRNKTSTYLVWLALLGIFFLQWRYGCNPKPPIEVEIVRVDTFYDTIYVRDTIVGEPEWVYHHYDTTIWVQNPEFAPSEDYDSLYGQYISLGNSHFSTNGFETKFPIDSFGHVTVYDTVQGNMLISSTLVSDLKIPEKTIVVEKLAPAKFEKYIGAGIMSDGIRGVNGVKVGLLFKDKRNRMYELSGGMFGKSGMFGVSHYRKF